MKVKDIKELINLRKRLIENKKIASISYINGVDCGVDHLFPNVSELKEQIDILKKEITDSKMQVEIISKKIQNINCNHPIALQYPCGLGTNFYCPLCGEKISEIDEGKTLTFMGTYDEEDYGTIEGFEIDDICKLILKAIEKLDDEDDIDLNSYLKNITIDGKKINDKAMLYKENVLIILGEPIHEVQAGINISASNNLSYDFFFNYLCNTNQRTHHDVVKLGNKDKRNAIKDLEWLYHVDYYSYETFSEANSFILKRNIPYDLIIDMSNPIDYVIEDNKIVKKEYSFNLKKIFPNSKIIGFTKTKGLTEKEILILLKQKLLEYDNFCVVNQNKKVYYYNYLNQDEEFITGNSFYDKEFKKILK